MLWCGDIKLLSAGSELDFLVECPHFAGQVSY
jgi:hypothetical protein